MFLHKLRWYLQAFHVYPGEGRDSGRLMGPWWGKAPDTGGSEKRELVDITEQVSGQAEAEWKFTLKHHPLCWVMLPTVFSQGAKC